MSQTQLSPTCDVRRQRRRPMSITSSFAAEFELSTFVFYSVLAMISSRNVTSNTVCQSLTSVSTDFDFLDPLDLPISFRRRVTALEHSIMIDIVQKFANICRTYNISYMIYSGTLLGSYRHHDIIPWDDDVDVFVDLSHRAKLMERLTALLVQPMNYGLRDTWPRIKLWSPISRWQPVAATGYKWPWLWPYVDISFYDQNKTHVWDAAPEFERKNFVYRKSILFPVHWRPLAGLRLSAPRDAYAALVQTYGSPEALSHCRSSHYDHRHERLIGMPQLVSCSLLKNVYGFVHRKELADFETTTAHGYDVIDVRRRVNDVAHGVGIAETLMLDDAIVSVVVVGEPAYAITDAYKLQLMEPK